MKFKQFLNVHAHPESLVESFNKPYKFKGNGLSKKEGNIKYTFMTEFGSEVEVYFESYFESDEDEDAGEESFSISFDRNGSSSVTGEGDAMRIFATVIFIIKEVVKKKNPKVMEFSAMKDATATRSAPGQGSREKLYDRMLKKYAGQMGYKYQKLSSSVETEFELRRK
jgi:hypothetical protein